MNDHALAILRTVQEEFPDSVADAAACTLEVGVSLILSVLPSSEVARHALHDMLDSYIDAHAAAADEHFAGVRDKAN